MLPRNLLPNLPTAFKYHRKKSIYFRFFLTYPILRYKIELEILCNLIWLKINN